MISGTETVTRSPAPLSSPPAPRRVAFAAAALGLLAMAGAARADGNADAGKQVFQNQCSSCHTVVPGQNGFGPSLAGVVGRRAGSLGNFKYSDAMAHSGLTWSEAEIESFIASSTTKLPGTAMQVAVADATARADVVAYLETLAGAPAQAAAPRAPTPISGGPTQAQLMNAAADKANWLYASKDWTGQRYVDLKEITPANASRLRASCIYRSNTAGSTQTNPLVYDGTIYFTIDEATVAIDAATCRERWTQKWEMKDAALSKSNRGVAIKDGRLVRGTPDGYLIALNMADGSVIWSRKIADAKTSQYLSMPPLIYEDMVIYGPAGADWGAKNWLGAFSLKTGEPIWRFNVIPEDGEPGADTWPSAAARQHGGGSLWTPLAFDAAKGVLWVPVGNPAPDFFRDARPGSNLYTNSAVALDVKTGKLIWYHQFGPADEHDRDLSQTSPLFSASVGGKTRNFVAVSGKDGLLRVLDRDSHDQLYEIPITDRTGFDVSPTPEGAHSCPGLLGGMEWNGPAYSPITHALYVATIDWCGKFTRNDSAPAFTANSHYYGGAVAPDPREQAKGWLQSVDATTGKVRWKRQWPTPLVAAVTATAGGVLFTGDLNNNFLAIDAASGRTLYEFNTGGSIGGGVISYALKGKQYVATTSGTVSGFFGGTGTSAIMVFALP